MQTHNRDSYLDFDDDDQDYFREQEENNNKTANEGITDKCVNYECKKRKQELDAIEVENKKLKMTVDLVESENHRLKFQLSCVKGKPYEFWSFIFHYYVYFIKLKWSQDLWMSQRN